jgi:hypothetical protein
MFEISSLNKKKTIEIYFYFPQVQIMVFFLHNILLLYDTNLQDFQNFANLLYHKQVKQSIKQQIFSIEMFLLLFTSAPNIYLSNMAPPNV